MEIGVVMDPIQSIKPAKDTTLALLIAAQVRGHKLWYMESKDMWIYDGIAWARRRSLSVRDDAKDYFSLGAYEDVPMRMMDVVLMRKDPPFDMNYITCTYILERAVVEGVRVVNHPRGLRDINEKAHISWFAHCCPPTLIAKSKEHLRAFIDEQGKIVLKPLDGMGGKSIFVIDRSDPNISVIIETMTEEERCFVMAQRYLPEIRDGDKRILLVNGQPVSYLLARVPAVGESRGNLAAGGRGEVRPLSPRDRWIAEQVGPAMKHMGMLFVGIDVIGDYLTEINVTSPTCLREIESQSGLAVAGPVIEALGDL